MKKALKVEGMTCQHCEKSVHDALANLDGVNTVEIDLDSGQVDVTFDEAAVSVEALKEAIDNQGYDVVE